MHFPTLLLALSSFLLTPILATQCHQDNCYRALSNRPSAASSFCSTFTTSTRPIPTATDDPIPFTSQCANSPYRLSSACKCVMPSPTTPPCKPTPAMDVAKNGGFDQVFIPCVGCATDVMPPWSWSGWTGGFGNWIREGPGTATGQGAAAWHITTPSIHDPASPSSGGILSTPLSICSGRSYTLTLYSRIVAPPPSGTGTCALTISSLLYGAIGSIEGVYNSAFTSTFSFNGPWEYIPDVGWIQNGAGKGGSRLQSDGSWNDTLSVAFACVCEGCEESWSVLAEVDTVMVV